MSKHVRKLFIPRKAIYFSFMFRNSTFRFGLIFVFYPIFLPQSELLDLQALHLSHCQIRDSFSRRILRLLIECLKFRTYPFETPHQFFCCHAIISQVVEVFGRLDPADVQHLGGKRQKYFCVLTCVYLCIYLFNYVFSFLFIY